LRKNFRARQVTNTVLRALFWQWIAPELVLGAFKAAPLGSTIALIAIETNVR